MELLLNIYDAIFTIYNNLANVINENQELILPMLVSIFSLIWIINLLRRLATK